METKKPYQPPKVKTEKLITTPLGCTQNMVCHGHSPDCLCPECANRAQCP